MTTPRMCKANAQSGEPCQAPAMASSDFCFAHDPSKADEAEAARRAGGVQRARQMDRKGCGAPYPLPAWWPLESAANACAGLGHVVRETLSGRLAARDANAAAGALSALVGALRASDLEQRLEALEKTLEHRSKP